MSSKESSFISDEESNECNDLITEILGFEPPRLCGYHVCVMLYLMPSEIDVGKESDNEVADFNANLIGLEKKPYYLQSKEEKTEATSIWLPEHLRGQSTTPSASKKLYIPDSAVSNSKYSSNVGLVLSVGKLAYRAEKFRSTGAWCKVGDWVAFPRHHGIQMTYRNVPVMILGDDSILFTVDRPQYVGRGLGD